MARALIQPERGAPAPPVALARRDRHTGQTLVFPIAGAPTTSPESSGRLSPGYGLLIAAGVSLGAWAGLVKVALTLLR